MIFEPSYFVRDVLEADLSKDWLFRLAEIESAELSDGDVFFTVQLRKEAPRRKMLRFDPGEVLDAARVRVRLYGDTVVRIGVARGGPALPDESPMLEWDGSMARVPCSLEKTETGWRISDGRSVRLETGEGLFAPVVLPDGKTRVELQGGDRFFASAWNSLAALLLEREGGRMTFGVSLAIRPGEHFCGTGERFDRIDLFGRRIDLVNEDAYGSNSERAYKNVPFLLSSRPYGVFCHSSAKMRLDIGCHSTRALQWLVDDGELDLFLIGGGSLEEVLLNYRRITGFPRKPPLWSFGCWMSRMTYTSDEEVSGIAERLRAEEYPMDVLHLDTGWFARDWKCDWTFSKERFPDPADFFRRMRARGFRVSLWQYPYVSRDIELSRIALEEGYVGRPSLRKTRYDWGDTIDFTNARAVEWYKGLLESLFGLGAAAIKTDFGENVDEQSVYQGAEARKYRNLFSLLYQKAAFEVTEKATGDSIIWARSGWAGAHRYPVHWGGDTSRTFEGLAGCLCGGLHLGLSGFAFWSHDIPGFYGFPEFLKTRPSPELYVRWTQFGAFTSHMRFHGTTPREPWEYPSVSGLVRGWLRLRYALLPYIVKQSERCCRTGLPMLRALAIGWAKDPAAWAISDEYMLGDDFLVCPVTSEDGVRDVYLPDGEWVDFWTGEPVRGRRQLERVASPLARMPVYLRNGAEVEFAEPVQCTDELAGARRFTIRFDDRYPGFEASELGGLIDI